MAGRSAYAEFSRAIKHRHLTHAEAAARELPHLSLNDSLALCLLYAEKAPAKYPRSAARWHARLVIEAGCELLESQLALTALMLLCGPARERASTVLLELAQRHRIDLRHALAPRAEQA